MRVRGSKQSARVPRTTRDACGSVAHARRKASRRIPTCAALTSRSTSIERLGVRMRVSACSTACNAWDKLQTCECQQRALHVHWVSAYMNSHDSEALSPAHLLHRGGHAREGRQLLALQARAHALNHPAGREGSVRK